MTYSTHQVAEMLQAPVELIREIARAGILDTPRRDDGRYEFTFQDMIVLRNAKELIDAGVKRRRVYAALAKLKAQLPASRPLTAVRISGQGGAVLLHEANQVYNPDTGQLSLNYTGAEPSAQVETLASPQPDAALGNQLSADDWFDLGADLETVSPADAPAAYHRALKLDPYHVDAHVNLGKLLQDEGQLPAAEQHYQQALQADPAHTLAAFNLGTLLENTGRTQQAIQTYQRAETLPDAQYNLSRLLELTGAHAEALKHFRAYRQLKEASLLT